VSDWKQRTQLLIGEDGLQKLEQSHVLVVGLGGVGSYAAEALVRAGVGKMTIVDGDVVDPTNKNRQLQALDSTIGQHKGPAAERAIFRHQSPYPDHRPLHFFGAGRFPGIAVTTTATTSH
jgi:tRNA A37 threonylcarbamoyladenosine dehydratase